MIFVSDKLLTQMVNDDYTAWANILNNRQISSSFLILLDRYNYTANRLKLVRSVLPVNLTDKQLYTLFNPNFSFGQLSKICACLQNNMPIHQIEILANPKLCDSQMDCLILCFTHEIDNSDIAALCSMPESCMQIICECLLEPYYFSKNTISMLIKSNIHSRAELSQVRRHIFNHIPANFICNPRLSSEQRAVICNAFDKGWSTEQISLFANPDLSVDQMHKISDLITNGYPLEDIKIIAHPCLSPEHIDALTYGYDLKLSREQIRSIAFNGDSPKQMKTKIMDLHKENQVSSLKNIIHDTFK